MAYVNAQELKERIKIVDVVSMLGLDLKRSGEQMRGACPACDTDNKRALTVTPGKGAYCHAAQRGGDLFWLVCHIRGIGFKDALTEVSEHFRLNGETRSPEPEPSNGRAREAEGTTPPTFQPLSYLEHDHDQVDMLGLSEIAEAVGIGYAPKGILRETVAVPIRKPDGSLVGYIGVTECKRPKSWHL